MLKKATVIVFAIGCILLLTAASTDEEGTQEFPVGSGGELVLDLKAGGSVEITGTGGSTVSVSYKMKCTPACDIWALMQVCRNVSGRGTPEMRNVSTAPSLKTRSPV